MATLREGRAWPCPAVAASFGTNERVVMAPLAGQEPRRVVALEIVTVGRLVVAAWVEATGVGSFLYQPVCNGRY